MKISNLSSPRHESIVSRNSDWTRRLILILTSETFYMLQEAGIPGRVRPPGPVLWACRPLELERYFVVNRAKWRLVIDF